MKNQTTDNATSDATQKVDYKSPSSSLPTPWGISSSTSAYLFGVYAVWEAEPPPGENIYVNVDDVHKQVAAVYVNVDDAWKEVTDISVNVDDAWKTV